MASSSFCLLGDATESCDSLPGDCFELVGRCGGGGVMNLDVWELFPF